MTAVRHFTIVGGGQAGLLLAIGLRLGGHQVRLVQDRGAEETARGRLPSPQCLFHGAVAYERSLGLDLWSEAAPAIELCEIAELARPGAATPQLSFGGSFRSPGQAIDPRLKFSAWLERLVELGGELEIATATTADIERYARESDLVVIAAGRGGFDGLFPRDDRNSPFATPQRALSLIYLKGAVGDARRPGIRSTGIAGQGTVIDIPVLTAHGAADSLTFEAFSGSALDVGSGRLDAAALAERMLTALREMLPDRWERFRDAQPVDDGAYLSGAVVPTVRNAVGVLPSGRAVLGIGDTVVTNDPITAQGANNATRLAALYVSAIDRRGDGAFDGEWMANLAAAAWARIRAATYFTNLTLLGAPTLVAALHRASESQAIADRFVEGFNEPGTILPFLMAASPR